MRTFDEIYKIAAERKGGAKVLEDLLAAPKSPGELQLVPDDRWLSCMSKCIFQAGFNWKVVESMWPGFEKAFHGFDIGRCAMLNDDDFDRLVTDKSIVRHGTKIRSVHQNALFLGDLAREHGSAAKVFATWPGSDYSGLLNMLKKRGSRLGGNTGQYFLRFMGVDSYILSRDVVARLIAEDVIDKAPTSQKAMANTQNAFNTLNRQSGRSLSEISRVLAMSV
ncbi:MAG: 3-methyladenine DNA glycosylase [Hyphomicrobiales bacterium]|nr:3-methyladenine DNA glycosylase [Hyphomicrobiales bacterium]